MSEDKQLEEAAEKTDEEAVETQTTKPNKASGILKFFVLIALLLAIAASAGGGYLWMQMQKMQQQSQTELSSLEGVIQSKVTKSEVTSLVQQSSTALQNDLSVIKKQLKEAAVHRERLNESAVKLFELYGRDKNGWQLAEVEYLLRIAQHRLVIEQDFEGAEKTLQAADSKLAEIADPGLLPVRVAISDERAELQSRSRPDLVGMVLNINQLIYQVPYLKVVTLNNQKTAQKTNTEAKKATKEPLSLDNWQQQLNGFISGLVKVGTIKPKENSQSVNVKDVLKVAEEQLKLAKWAVLERNQRQYKSLIKQVEDVLSPYYDETNPSHTSFFHHLSELEQADIKVQLPDISGSLLLLKREMIKQQHVVSEAVQSVEVKQAISDLATPTESTEAKGDDSHE